MMPPMNTSVKRIRQIKRAVYLIAFYVLAQFIWWAYLIIQQSQLIYGEASTRKITMVLGEGAIFILLVLVGFWYVIRSFTKEQQFMSDRQNFLLSVTHELKSPIASLKLAMQTLLKNTKPDDQNQYYYQSSLEQTDRLNRLVNNILLTSSIENQAYLKHVELISINPFIQSIFKDLSAQYKKPIALFTYHSSIDTISSDAQALQSILYNLLENAVKYSEIDQEIQLDIHKKQNKIELIVSDYGFGIPNEEKTRVFDLFYRIGNENSRSKPGTGLGLYIVYKMTDVLGGSIQILDRKPKGTIFNVLIDEG